MHRISLDGDWQLSYFREGEHAISHPDQLADSGVPTILKLRYKNLLLRLASDDILRCFSLDGVSSQ